MNAYPPELISHHFPLILLSGILPPSSSTAAVDGAATSAPPAVAPVDEAGLTPPTQAFSSLCADLRAVVASRGRETAWDPARGRSTAFKTVLVEPTYRLPLPKSRPLPRGLTAPPSSAAAAADGEAESQAARAWSELTAQPARSPLSPTHPASPLWPDGMIAPLWARRYREGVGAVWVMVAVLPSSKQASQVQGEQEKSEEKEQQTEEQVQEAEAQIKLADEALIKAIADRKRTLSERGIKLTVVLLTQREMLDSPTLEPRLSHIRRSSTLDSKASLFVLTPVARADLSAFLTSLHTALFPCAVDYYLEHARRLRRKRGRYPPNNAAVHDAVTALRGAQPPALGREGWAVRAEYKLGTFVELAGDTPSALTHYVSAYAGILTLLRSTAALPPRTKRWAEAKVLADALCLRIVRLYLYDGRADDASRQFAEHMTKLGELSSGWGMGAESAEWWSWAGKQYRLMGDLTDLSLRQTQLPPLPLLAPSLPAHLLEQPVVPTAQSRGPAAFWFAAGLCAVERRNRFLRMKGEEADAASGGGWSVLEHERKVNHAGLIAEAFARSDDLAKRAGHALTAPSLATSIASAHLDAGEALLALRYLEGLVKSYNNASLHSPETAGVLLLLVKCAQTAGEVDAELKALLQVLRTDVALTPEQRQEAGQSLAALVATKELPKDSATPIRIESAANDGLLLLDAAFLTAETDLGAPAHFQVRLTAPVGSRIESITFDELRIVYDDERPAIVVRHEMNAEEPASQLVQLSTVSIDASEQLTGDAVATADLRWAEGTVKVLQGSLLAETTRPARIARVELKAGGERLPFELSFALPLLSGPQEPVQARWYTSVSPPSFVYLAHAEDPTSVSFRRRPHRLSVSIEHAPIAYLDDATPIKVVVKNDDSEALHVSVDAMLHSAPSPDARDVLLHATSTSGISGALRDLTLGVVEPGTQRSETFFVRVQHGLGLPRSLDVFVRSIPPSAVTPDLSPGGTAQPSLLACEATHSVTIDTRAMFSGTHAASWRAPRGTSFDRPRTPLRAQFGEGADDGASDGGDSFAFGGDGSAPASTVAELASCIHVVGEAKVQLESVALKLDASSQHLRLEGSGAPEEADQLAGEWSLGDRWGGMHEIEVVSNQDGTSPEASDGTVRPTGHLEVTWSRAEGEKAPQLNKTLLPLPVLLPPHLNARLLVAAPPVALVDQPFVALLTVVNPHPTLTADVYVGLDASDVFFLAGPRTLTIPSLVPRSTRSVPLRIVARADGRHVLPRVRAWDRRQRFLSFTATLEGPDASTPVAAPAPTAAPANADQDNYGEPHAPAQPAQTGPPASVVNERQGLGIPLSVRFRHSSGGGLSVGAQRALQAEAQAGGPRLPPALLNAERRGAALSVLVLRP